MKTRGEGSLYFSWQHHCDPEKINSVGVLRFRHIKQIILKFKNKTIVIDGCVVTFKEDFLYFMNLNFNNGSFTIVHKHLYIVRCRTVTAP